MKPDDSEKWSKIKTLLKNMAVWLFVGIFMGMAVGGYTIYSLNDWLMARTIKTMVMLYPDPIQKKDRIFDLKERL